ncbi:MAG: TldD/PmbA family protein [Thermoplasmatales archaeon]|nr:TldD/PmbA family protein [Thermoplasmatales archaeon]
MEELAEYAIKNSKYYTEIRIEKEKIDEIIFTNGEFIDINSDEKYGFSIRVIDKSVGFYSSNVVNKKEIRRGLEIAEKIASIGKNKIFLSEEKINEDRYEIKGKDFQIDEKIDLLKNLSGFNKKNFISFREKQIEKIYMNSEGSKIFSKIPRVYLYYLITVGREQASREFGNVSGCEVIEEWRIEEKMEEDINFLKKIEKGKKAPKKGDVILSPLISGLIAHEGCGHPFEADRIVGRELAQAGKSYIRQDMLGRKIANEVVSIEDNPLIEGAYGYYKYDDEGVKARKRELIKEGKINEFLHNRQTAYEMNCKSNASSRANYGKEPIIRMANTYFKQGDYSFEEMVEEIKNGVYMITFMEWNIDDRRINQKYVGNEAYTIKNGEIAGIAKHPCIELSTFEIFSKIDAVGKNIEFHPATCGKSEPIQDIEVSTGGADIRIRDIRIK